MDARKLSEKVIREAIEKQAYEMTGITENGEVVLTIITNSEINLLNRILENEKTEEEKLIDIKKVMSLKGRDAGEYMQIYLQNIATRNEVCKVNGLRLK